MLTLLLLSACDVVGYRFPGATVTVDPADTLDLGVVVLGEPTSADLVISNGGTVAATVAITVDAPFTVSTAELTVIPGESQTFAVRYTPAGYEPVSGAVHLAWDDGASGADVAVTAATDPDSDGDGVDATEAGGADCDDGDAAAYPGAPDTCYDRIDQDCDAVAGVDPDDQDCDGDGHLALDAGGDDCDDGDASVHPGQPEVSGDGVDQDCDGLRDEDDRAYGDLVLSEVHDGGDNPGWLELCNATVEAIPLDGFVVSWDDGAYVVPTYDLDAGACVAICERASNDCALVGEIRVSAASDTVTIAAADTLLDTVVIQPAWAWEDGDTWSLDPDRLDADLNDAASSWCDTRGSQGAMNPPCP